MRVGGQKILQAVGAEEFSFPVARLGDSVRIEKQNIAGVQPDAPFLIRGIVKNADRETRELELLDAPVFPEQRLRLPGIGHAELVAPLLPGGEANRHVAAVDAAVAHQLIELAKKFRGLELVRRKAAQEFRSRRRHRAPRRFPFR